MTAPLRLAALILALSLPVGAATAGGLAPVLAKAPEALSPIAGFARAKQAGLWAGEVTLPHEVPPPRRRGPGG